MEKKFSSYPFARMWYGKCSYRATESSRETRFAGKQLLG